MYNLLQQLPMDIELTIYRMAHEMKFHAVLKRIPIQLLKVMKTKVFVSTFCPEDHVPLGTVNTSFLVRKPISQKCIMFGSEIKNLDNHFIQECIYSVIEKGINRIYW